MVPKRFLRFLHNTIFVSQMSFHSRRGFLWRFTFGVFSNVTPKQWFENGMLIISELFAGDVLTKWKKSHSLCGGVEKMTNRIPTLHADQKKKRLPCSMGVPKLIFSTPLGRECEFENRSFFCCCWFWWIWGGEKVVKMSEPVRFCIFRKFIRLYLNC